MAELSRAERWAVEAALAATRDRRHWVRLRAVLLLTSAIVRRGLTDHCLPLGSADHRRRAAQGA
jgi:hypothetical protein